MAPAPCAKIRGIKPAINANEVIKIGLKRLSRNRKKSINRVGFDQTFGLFVDSAVKKLIAADLDPEVRSKKKIEKYNNDLRVLKEKQESIESIFAEMGFIKRFVSKKGREGEKELKEIKDKIAELQSKIRLCDLSGINIEQDVNDPRRVYLQEQKRYIESDIASVKNNLEKIK